MNTENTKKMYKQLSHKGDFCKEVANCFKVSINHVKNRMLGGEWNIKENRIPIINRMLQEQLKIDILKKKQAIKSLNEDKREA